MWSIIIWQFDYYYIIYVSPKSSIVQLMELVNPMKFPGYLWLVSCTRTVFVHPNSMHVKLTKIDSGNLCSNKNERWLTNSLFDQFKTSQSIPIKITMPGLIAQVIFVMLWIQLTTICFQNTPNGKCICSTVDAEEQIVTLSTWCVI